MRIIDDKILKISVALCTFNGEKFIKKQLYSILQQSVLPDEIIVCDDGSTDNTISLIKEILNESKVSSRIYINSPNLGTVKNFEKAISLTTGDLIFLSDQDDIWFPKKIETIVSVFIAKPKALLVFSEGILIDENDNRLESTLWEKWGFESEMRERWKNNKIAFSYLFNNYNKVTGATIAFRKRLKIHTLPIQVPKDYWHDAWLALHAAGKNGLLFIEESLIQYRIHENQQVGIPESIHLSKNIIDYSNSISDEQFRFLIRKRYPLKFTDDLFVFKLFMKIKRKVINRLKFF